MLGVRGLGFGSEFRVVGQWFRGFAIRFRVSFTFGIGI